jgi:hypothetical protein
MKRSRVRGSAYAGSLIVRRSISSCDAVLDGGLNAIESSLAIPFRAPKQIRLEFRCNCLVDTSSCSGVLASRSDPNQQTNCKMDAGDGPQRWGSAGASLEGVRLVQNIGTGGGVRLPGAERRRSLTKIRASESGQVRCFVPANVGERVAANY